MIHSLDLVVAAYISSIRTAGLIEYMFLLTTLFDVTLPTVIVTLCVTGFIYLVRGIRYALLFLFTMISGAGIAYVLKLIFDVSRPTDQVMAAFGSSFPSYHALISTVFFGMIMYIFDSYLSKPYRIICNTLSVLAILLVSITRLYLGVHWLSDVVGGIVFGIIILFVAVKMFRFFNKKT